MSDSAQVSSLELFDETPLLLRWARRWRPREGWLILGLAWVGVSALPGAAAEGQLLAGVGVSLILSTLGLFFGWWLGHRRWRGGVVAPLSFVTGIIATLIWGVHVLNPWPSVWQGGRWLAWWVQCGAYATCKIPAPALTGLRDQAIRLSEFFERVRWWTDGVVFGRGIPDNLVLVGFAALLAWCLAAWAGWWLARHGRVFLALLPTGFLLPQQVYNADAGYSWLLVFLGALTLLLVLARGHRLAQSWDAAGVDYSAELWLDNGLVALGLAALVLVSSPLLPSLSPRSISEAFWRTFEAPYRDLEERMGQSFPGVESRRSLVPPLGVAAGGLPRAHLLGGRPELGREIALQIQVRGGQPGERFYWRGQTFAFYTGRGWGEDVGAWAGAPKPVELGPGQPWTDFKPPYRHSVLASVQVFEATRAVLYGAGEPVSADRPYRATLRAPGELVNIAAADAPDRYTVLGAVANPSPDVLRATGIGYPATISDLYLQLPADLSLELIATARQITSDAATPYDKALAIEATLRQLPYTLDVPAPPKDREVVSWFLFDLRQGYCDYFATAMVVLARLNGIPARLAIGYATGDYEAQTDRYVVTELNAHSWVEIYFSGLGWIPFEPTPGQPALARLASSEGGAPIMPPDFEQADLASGLAELRQLGATQARVALRVTWAQRAAGLVNLLLVLWQAAAWIRLRRPHSAATAYDRLTQWGSRLGCPMQPADTPREYAAAISAAAGNVALTTRRDAVRLAQAHALVQSDAARLAETVEAALYGPAAAFEPMVAAEHARWRPLWRALRRVWLARGWTRGAGRRGTA